ncbi:APC family permease [Frigoriglobus tundricola]|uniref:Putative amino acid permease, GabP family n=1 Tax=Frigoriglobus tundricola TaxID=2774151 RepID=A0A6M5YJR5_9BACT|nr:APC family permease [Frigoriglobus tundricola]QJW93541.1 putative amino acid permease, GabP family [Frigoriglobus tundricola]
MALYDWLFGRPLATAEEEGERVGAAAGIPMLGLDALSSAAYGPEAALTILIVLGAGGTTYANPITLLIVILLALVYFSYRQTIAAYPNGGGSYTVAKENLGVGPGLLAAAALMIDYVLVVAVGVSAGVGALVSAAPELQPYTLTLCLVILGLIAAMNLRGARESGVALAVPTYLFIASLFGVIAVGLGKALASGGQPSPVVPPPVVPAATEAATWWLLAKAFASGCTAMTGVEAVSNGVAAFREPRVKNAQRTLTAIIVILAVLLLGIAYLCKAYGIGATEPGAAGYESTLSQLVGAVAGRGAVYYVTIASVLAVLCLSANTGFADFPRLCRAVALDGFLPNGFAHRGRRLVYTEGILVITVLSAVLLVAFDGVTDHLIPLFAVGAFLAFTLSQIGMVVHWLKHRPEGQSRAAAKWAAVVNGLGALGTGVALVVVLVAKFVEGAWVTVALVATLVALFVWVRRHYRSVAREVASTTPLAATNLNPPLVVVLVRGWSRVTRKALRMAMRLSPNVYALHIAADEQRLLALEEEWEKYVTAPCLAAGVAAPQLAVVTSPYRRLYGPLMEFIGDMVKTHPNRHIAVVVPELVERKWYHFLLHNQTAALIKGYLYFSGLERVVVVNVPWYLKGDEGAGEKAPA